jgi:hypothetical protein
MIKVIVACSLVNIVGSIRTTSLLFLIQLLDIQKQLSKVFDICVHAQNNVNIIIHKEFGETKDAAYLESKNK